MKKGKLCAGHLKRRYFFGDEVIKKFGADAEVYRCDHCYTLCVPNPEEDVGLVTAARRRYHPAMRFRVFCLLSLPCWATECIKVEPRLAPQYETGSVTVHAFDITGVSMTQFQSQLLNPRTREKTMPSFREKSTDVPYGIYLLRAESQGFSASEQIIHVSQPETVVRAQLTIAWPCTNLPHLGGSISPVSADRDVWVKLIPLRGSGGRETKAAYGFFGFANVDAGQHLIIVMEGESVRHTRLLTVKADTQIRIDLDSVTP